MGRRGRRRPIPRRKNWQAVRWFGGLAIVGVYPLSSLTFSVLANAEPYNGKQAYLAVLFLAAAVALVSWIPHFLVIDDGYLPAFNHEQNTAALFWYLVATTTLCGLLVGLAPILPLLDGYDFTTEVPFPGAKYGAARLPLWFVLPVWWALAAVLFVRTGRGLLQRLTP